MGHVSPVNRDNPPMSDMRFTTPLPLADFRDWLWSGAEHAICGVAFAESDCPLARYLSGAYGYEWLVLPPQFYPAGHSEYAASLPLWAVAFVEQVDRAEGTITFGQARLDLSHVLAAFDRTDDDDG